MSLLRLKDICKRKRPSRDDRDTPTDAASAVGGIVAGSAGASTPSTCN